MPYHLIALFLVPLTVLGPVASITECPPELNIDTVCKGAVTKLNCPSGFVYQAKLLGCSLCPGCVRYRRYGETCQDPELAPRATIETVSMKDGVAHVRFTTCGTGLTCDPATKTCVPAAETTKCLTALDKFRTADPPDTLGYEPVCQPDGKYAPVQCRGSSFNGICFCVDEEGTRQFGRDLIKNRDTMNCACSRRYYELKDFYKRDDITLHCLPNGSYEPLQCDSDVCFCVNSTTGVPYGATVSREQWTGLPCYAESDFPGVYERLCESMNRESHKLTKMLDAHGVIGMQFLSACNPDGGFYPKTCNAQEQICKCRDRAGNNIEPYRVDASHIDDTLKMNCQCAVDHNDYDAVAYKTHHLQCDTNGNYKGEQCDENECFCVDDWGTRTTRSVDIHGPVGTLIRCCLPCLKPGTLNCDDPSYKPYC